MLSAHWNRKNRDGFTLVELMAVVAIILIMVASAGVVFLNGRQSIKIRSDANRMISFMKTMLDYTKATGAPLILQFGGENQSFSYIDPRNGESHQAKFQSKARVLAFKLNDRLYLPDTQINPDNGVVSEEDAIYLSEGRGLISLAVLLGVRDDNDKITNAILSRLNLISGKGGVYQLNPEDVETFLTPERGSAQGEP